MRSPATGLPFCGDISHELRIIQDICSTHDQQSGFQASYISLNQPLTA